MDQTKTYRDFDLVVSKYLGGEASRDEKSWLLNAIKNNSDLKAAFHAMQSSYRHSQVEVTEFDSTQAFASFRKASGIADRKTKQRSISLAVRWAAAAAVLLIGGSALYFSQPAPMQELRSDAGLVAQTTADGSVITLNEHSHISYPEDFEESRSVDLKGQAFFEVAPDPEHPFTVSVGDVSVTVLGTAFDISSYPGSDSISVVVSHGKVMVAAHGDTTYLTKGDRADYSKSTKTLKQAVNEDLNYQSWKTNKLQFDGTPLYQVCADLQKYYKKPIILQTDSISNCRLTATYDNYPLDLTLEMLQVAFNITIEERDSSYFISGEKCNF